MQKAKVIFIRTYVVKSGGFVVCMSTRRTRAKSLISKINTDTSANKATNRWKNLV